jgi:hypothetical protein
MSAVARSWGPRFFPHGSWGQVEPTAVQRELRQAFRRWGRPQRFRVDNGTPWGSWGDLPTDLALWLLGLEIDMIWNPPRRPQHNGVVERSQGTGKRWAEPQTCASVEELQRRLQEMDQIQREEYPSLGGQSRLAAFPELEHSGRPYTLVWERQHWSWQQVMTHLAGYAVPRRVDKGGMVSLYNRNCYVGTLHRGKMVFVMVDPELCEWIFADEKGQQLRRRAAEELSQERIIGLTVTHRD